MTRGNLIVRKSFLKTVVDVFEALEGEWNLSRNIVPGGQMSGRGVFKRTGDNKLEYNEVGILTLDNGHVLQAQKRYDYFLKDEGKIEIYFADGVTSGELFQTLVFNEEGMAKAEHFCNPDHYKSEYDFSGLPEVIKINHEVTGAKKDYVSETTLTQC